MQTEEPDPEYMATGQFAQLVEAMPA